MPHLAPRPLSSREFSYDSEALLSNDAARRLSTEPLAGRSGPLSIEPLIDLGSAAPGGENEDVGTANPCKEMPDKNLEEAISLQILSPDASASVGLIPRSDTDLPIPVQGLLASGDWSLSLFRPTDSVWGAGDKELVPVNGDSPSEFSRRISIRALGHVP